MHSINIFSGGALKHAARHGIILVCPDTSPSISLFSMFVLFCFVLVITDHHPGGAGVEGETDSWDFGKPRITFNVLLHLLF